MKLSYNKVFDRYTMSFSDKLAESSYSLYRTLRLQLAKIFPLSEHEKYRFDDDLFSKEEAADMPQGFDYIEKKDVDSFVKLDYIDLYDYLPKEDLPKFIKELKKCVRRNKIAPFGAFRSREDIDKIDNFGRYYDGQAFTHILSVQFRKNEKLQQSCSDLSVSLRNLSATFLLVQYRVYITKEFNTKIAEVCKKKYSGYTMVYRQFNTPWYAVKKFGRSSHTGNNVRQEKIYKMISQLKWQILMEIRKTYSVRFWDDGIFTPTFETYSTNIRPSNERRNLEFWDSISFDRVADYAPTYNACVCWDYKHGENEGIRLSAFCGGNYSRDDHLPEIAHHDISDIYGVYLTAATLEYVADRDIAICNKKISKVIRKTKTSSVLKVRVAVERKLYYCYRFISEFSGKSIDHDDVKAFRHQFYKKGSVSSRSLEGISKRIKETKVQIDNILKLLNDAAEYRSSESNIKLQWIMMIVTILSLFVALYSIKNGDVINEIKKYKADYEDISDTLTSSQWDAIHSGMREVVSTMDRFQGFDIPVAGKTGTAQQTGHANHGLFVGYAPYDDPEITIAVRIANGYSSHNAATAARNVISYYYKETSMKDIKEMKAAGANGNIRNSVAD